jgi:hypothetical protein
MLPIKGKAAVASARRFWAMLVTAATFVDTPRAH